VGKNSAPGERSGVSTEYEAPGSISEVEFEVPAIFPAVAFEAPTVSGEGTDAIDGVIITGIKGRA
jgi:hypothetical protein